MKPAPASGVDRKAALIDLAAFLSVMFLIRMVSVPALGVMGNVLLNSLVTLAVATWRLRARGLSWWSLGLERPEDLRKTAAAVVLILVLVIVSVVALESAIGESSPSPVGADASPASTESRFEGMEGNLSYFLSIILLVWIESFFEELQDRGFLLNWLERLFTGIPFPVVLAVVTQAAIFGFRHSPTHGVSGAVVTGTIGLILGIAYVVAGRNLWAPILAHSVLNSLSMVERFLGTS